MEFMNNDIAKGIITKQDLLMTRPKDSSPSVPFLRLTVKVTGKLANPRRSDSAVLAVAPGTGMDTEELHIYFPTEHDDDPDRAALKTAEAFLCVGFDDTNYCVLSPDHPEHTKRGNLIGKTVYIRKWIKSDGKQVWQPHRWDKDFYPKAQANDINLSYRSCASRLKAAMDRVKTGNAGVGINRSPNGTTNGTSGASGAAQPETASVGASEPPF